MVNIIARCGINSRLCRLPRSGSTSRYICPPPDPKNKNAESYVKSKGIFYDRYDSQLHYAFAHFRRVKGQGVPLASGRKTLDLLAAADTPR